MLNGVEALLFTLKESDQAKLVKQRSVLLVIWLSPRDAGVDRLGSVRAVVVTDHRRRSSVRESRSECAVVGIAAMCRRLVGLGR